MRTPILIALAAATALSSPAAASTHSRHHSSSSHHERHKSDRHGSSRNNDRHSRHNYSSSAYSRQDYSRERQRSAYVAPYRNWSYRRVPVGYHLNSQYYSPRYTISNYGYYGLRAPGRYMRWIRYGNDLLLVDIRYGTVVQVIPGGYYY